MNDTSTIRHLKGLYEAKEQLCSQQKIGTIEKQRVIASTLNSLSQVVLENEKLIQELNNRLESVIVNGPSNSVSDKRECYAPLLAEEIMSQFDRIAANNDTLRSIIERLEL